MSEIIQMQKAESRKQKRTEGRCLETGDSAFCLLPSVFRRGCRGFTLVEMLVVISIIGVLVSLASVAVFKALVYSKAARIKMEISNLENALRAQYGADLPPSFLQAANRAEIQHFLAKRYGRCDAATETTKLLSYNLGPQQALVFWLQGVSKNQAQPISDPNFANNRETPAFDFDRTRLMAFGSSPFPVYVPLDGKSDPTHAYYYFAASDYIFHARGPTGSPPSNPVPYLQEPWDSGTSGLTAGTPPQDDIPLSSGVVTAASMSAYQKLCANPKTCQIISAGLDGDFGAIDTTTAVAPTAKFTNPSGSGSTAFKLYYKSYPTGIGYDKTGADDDNITNFCEKNGLGDVKP